MSFIASIFKKPTQAPQPAPIIQAAQPQPEPFALSPAGDAELLRRKRRGAGTTLTGQETVLGATQGKTLLGT